MPGIVRVGKDSHIGHASSTPNAFHRTSYATGSPNVFTNDAKSVRIGDTTACTDAAVEGSGNVYVNNIPVHRLADATQGHASWVPNAAATSSGNVFANGGAGTPGSPPEGADSATNNTLANQRVLDERLPGGEYTHTSLSVCTAFNFTSGECED
jgi:uncharacterized Zn-binding protein involved in type VI secretion